MLNNKLGKFSLCQESLNEALVAFAELEVTELKLFSAWDSEKGVREFCWLWTAPASCCHARALYCLPTHKNVQFLLLFYFGLEEGRGSRLSELLKWLWKTEIIFPVVPLKFVGRIWNSRVFLFLSFFFVFFFPVFLLQIIRFQGDTGSLV